MSADRLWEAVHGHAGVLATVALAHPAWLLWRGRPLSRGGLLAVVLSTALVAIAFGMGAAQYASYRAQVKPELFRLAPGAGWLFETKEHLGFVTLALALSGCAAALLAPRSAHGARRASARLYAGAALACAATAAIGTWVASVHGF